jgi:hypothetical protein
MSDDNIDEMLYQTTKRIHPDTKEGAVTCYEALTDDARVRKVTHIREHSRVEGLWTLTLDNQSEVMVFLAGYQDFRGQIREDNGIEEIS